MATRLVVCCDGTWKAAESRAGSPTNVVKIALTVARTSADGFEQRVFYAPGVGTKRFDRLRGGVLGMGLSANVRAAYRYLVEHYHPGDELFLFGFSRGAFTVRSLAGLVRNSGIVRHEQADRVAEAYQIYRDRDPHLGPDGIGAQLFRRSYAHEPGVRCLGVFDTVGALGIPVGSALGPLVNRRWGFHDTTLGPTVDAAFQALAMDERRGPFVPTLWSGAVGARQRVEQAWFRGSHSDVGGGYDDPSLAETALLWMVARATECGLEFRSDAFGSCTRLDPAARDEGRCVAPDEQADRHESRTGGWRLVRPFERVFGTSGNDTERLADPVVRRSTARPDDPVPEGFRAVPTLATPREPGHVTLAAGP